VIRDSVRVRVRVWYGRQFSQSARCAVAQGQCSQLHQVHLEDDPLHGLPLQREALARGLLPPLALASYRAYGGTLL
jgi:hypothetical protein